MNTEAAELLSESKPIAAAAKRLGKSSRIALDSEGDGMFRYRASLCVLQLANTEEIVLLDTLAMDDLAPIAALLGPKGPVKVIHDASFDLRLVREAGMTLSPVLDTSIMARFLGETALGLGSLVEKFIGVVLEKSKQQEDWGKRPLSPDHIRYLEDDVRYLLPLADALWQKVETAGIHDEVAEECAYVVWSATQPDTGPVKPVWQRIKGWDKLDERGKAVLREVCLERERLAEARNVPPYRICSNAALLDLARTPPRGRDDWNRMKGVPKPPPLARPLLDAVRRGVSAKRVPDEERPERQPAPAPDERARTKKRHTALTKWRAAEAKAREVNEQVVLPGHCLHDLAARGPANAKELLDVPGFGAFRVERYGDSVLKALSSAS
ncbi:MAG: HRDC domain-containing protein [Polyangiales bacterium]|nr:HRDC domain-containing protein [Myxococcales bacterium]